MALANLDDVRRKCLSWAEHAGSDWAEGNGGIMDLHFANAWERVADIVPELPGDRPRRASL